jgi:hypothetical protein
MAHPDHDESRMDEALDESFPASDPPAISSPSGSMAIHNLAKEGRADLCAEDEPKKKTSSSQAGKRKTH